jgi:flagellar biosynthesis component FlhA
LGVQEVENLLETWGHFERGDSLIKAALPDQPSRLRFARALRTLVKESVPITAWEEILETFRGIGLANDNISEVVRAVRLRLKRMLPGNAPNARHLEFPSEWEAKMVTWLRRENGREHFVPPPDESHDLLSEISDLVGSEDFALVIKNFHLRPFVQRLIETRFPDLMTLSQEEQLACIDLPAAPPAQTDKQAEGASGDE